VFPAVVVSVTTSVGSLVITGASDVSEVSVDDDSNVVSDVRSVSKVINDELSDSELPEFMIVLLASVFAPEK
jgi:hypothetical protein